MIFNLSEKRLQSTRNSITHTNKQPRPIADSTDKPKQEIIQEKSRTSLQTTYISISFSLFYMESLEEMQEHAYSELGNYKIEHTGEGRECVAVYFTSNALFFPHDAEHFRHSVLEKDYYEWTRQKIRRATKHIFLRDIFKQWYARGINRHINSIDKLTEWLKQETNNYNSLIFIGSSGGGTRPFSQGASYGRS